MQQQSTGAANAVSQNAPVNETQFRQHLQQAGFKDIEFVSAAYVVQADTPSGDTVVMAINPAQAASGGNVTSGSGTSTAQAANGGQMRAASRGELRQSLQKSGFTNVQVISAAYVLRATTPDGQRIAMTVSPAQ